jgi:hypothetical protein
MELIETYKGVKIFKSSRTTFFKIGSVISGDVPTLEFARKLIDLKNKKDN